MESQQSYIYHEPSQCVVARINQPWIYQIQLNTYELYRHMVNGSNLSKGCLNILFKRDIYGDINTGKQFLLDLSLATARHT